MDGENNIRKAVKDDIPDILKLLGQVNDLHAEGRPDLFIGGRTKYTADEIGEIIERSDRAVFVYSENGGVSGYAFCELNDFSGSHNLTDRREIYIDDICVDETRRGDHIGTKLYRYVRKYAADNGFYRITLNVWSLNPDAEAFYRSLGMKVFKLGMEDIL